MPFIVYPFLYDCFDLTVAILDHLARTRPDPPQVEQVLYCGPLVFFAARLGFVVVLPFGLGCRIVTVVDILPAIHITYP